MREINNLRGSRKVKISFVDVFKPKSFFPNGANEHERRDDFGQDDSQKS